MLRTLVTHFKQSKLIWNSLNIDFRWNMKHQTNIMLFLFRGKFVLLYFFFTKDQMWWFGILPFWDVYCLSSFNKLEKNVRSIMNSMNQWKKNSTFFFFLITLCSFTSFVPLIELTIISFPSHYRSTS